jgi:acyl-[acyl-carrier-protein]-phospholipid O-acyltransferase/long-chain-fatty-acid--[acyl-carrier-protein] ligase
MAKNDQAEIKVKVQKPKGFGLFTRGFVSLTGVSFFGAANDNILKQVLTLMVVAGGLWANRLGAGTQSIIMLVLTVPFIILSGYAGQVADKFSKQRVILWVKIAEIPIAICALIGLFFGSFWLSLFALLLLAIQSSFYGPAKYGVIPDIVDSHRLSQANGTINAISNVAVILGSLMAGPLADMYYPTVRNDHVDAAVVSDEPADSTGSEEENSTADTELTMVRDLSRDPKRLPIGLALVAVSIFGLVCAALMPKMKPVDPDLKISADLFGCHIQTFKDSNRPLLVVLFSWSGFYLIAALALLFLPEYRLILGVSNTAIMNLVGLLAVSIMIGSVTVGFLSGKSIRPYFALAGAIGMSICFGIMGLASMTYWSMATLIFLIGFFAGFYIVPLQALLQFLSPSDERGRFFGTANALSFSFITAAAAIYWSIAQLGMPVAKMPLLCAGFAIVGTIVGGIELNRIMTAQKSRRIALDQQEGVDSNN